MLAFRDLEQLEAPHACFLQCSGGICVRGTNQHSLPAAVTCGCAALRLLCQVLYHLLVHAPGHWCNKTVDLLGGEIIQ